MEQLPLGLSIAEEKNQTVLKTKQVKKLVTVYTVPVRVGMVVMAFFKIQNTKLPWMGFEIKSLRPQAGMLPIEPPFLVSTSLICLFSFILNLLVRIVYN